MVMREPDTLAKAELIIMEGILTSWRGQGAHTLRTPKLRFEVIAQHSTYHIRKAS